MSSASDPRRPARTPTPAPRVQRHPRGTPWIPDLLFATESRRFGNEEVMAGLLSERTKQNKSYKENIRKRRLLLIDGWHDMMARMRYAALLLPILAAWQVGAFATEGELADGPIHVDGRVIEARERPDPNRMTGLTSFL